MITDELFERLLADPVLVGGANRLYVVSGYATAAMAFHHLEHLRLNGREAEVHLIVGMCGQDGLSQSNHRGFQHLMDIDYIGRFECSYLVDTVPVHSKVYTWCLDDQPIMAFAGSANYTQTGFERAQREAMARIDPDQGMNYFNQFVASTIFCTHGEAEDFVQIYNDRYFAQRQRAIQQEQAGEEPSLSALAGLEHVNISLLDFRTGMILPERSGLNWGQRPELGREPNQAYIHLPASIYNTDFFPRIAAHFTVLTDDSRVLICTRAQAHGKAIHTPHNNSLIGEYFRHRLGVPNGGRISADDLRRYGRTDVEFYKIDKETYYMDFSTPANG